MILPLNPNAEDQSGTKPDFIPGLDLAEGFFHEAVQPILDSLIPHLRYSAGLIGAGSEVLGFDTAMSTDHHWGPRVMLFLRPQDVDTYAAAIDTALRNELPVAYRGYPTHWSRPDAADNGVQHLQPTAAPPVNHRVEILTSRGFFADYMGIDPKDDLRPADWLTLPQQKLRSVCAGRLFRDDLDLQAVRDRLAWYPHDVWLYILAACWSRIGQEEHLTGRAGSVGDEIGAAVIAWRLVRDIMRLAFMLERTYPAYAKWLGTAFRQLRCAPMLEPILTELLGASSWTERDPLLAEVYRQLATMHNALGITPPLSTDPAHFWGRPFTVIHGERFAQALLDEIQDAAVRRLARRSPIGSIDLVSDNTDLLEDPTRRSALLALYE